VNFKVHEATQKARRNDDTKRKMLERIINFGRRQVKKSGEGR